MTRKPAPPTPEAKPPPGTEAEREYIARERAQRAYHDERCLERSCDHCGQPYKGPAVYCSPSCALADA
jgi:hypothetical protein